MRDIEIVMEVQNLYKLGYSVAEISRKLKKSSSNVSRWCRKAVEGDNSRKISPQDVRRKHWFDFDRVDIGSLSIEQCRLFLSILYWCEGAKYPASGELAFTSSDEEMQQVFIKLMRKAYPEEIEESKFRVVLQIPDVYEVEEIKAYWSKLLDIPLAQFYKPYMTKTRGSRYRNLYRGTCGLRYHDYRILLRIMGTYNQVAKQIIGGVR